MDLRSALGFEVGADMTIQDVMKKNNNREYKYFKNSHQETKTYNLTLEIGDEARLLDLKACM